MDTAKLEFLRGTLDVLILKALVWGPLHGYAITNLIRRQSDDALLVEEGTLYPALWRLENKGPLEAEWGFSENNRKAKFYQLTAKGGVNCVKKWRPGRRTRRPWPRCWARRQLGGSANHDGIGEKAAAHSLASAVCWGNHSTFSRETTTAPYPPTSARPKDFRNQANEQGARIS
jgi:transcriptional regulator